jgi:DNA-binding CsgD family transcriptional regulator
MGEEMKDRPEFSQVASSAILDAVGRTSGVPLGVVSVAGPELLYANAELDALMQKAGVSEAKNRARWLLGTTHPGDGYEVCTSELGSDLVMVSAQVARGSRLGHLIDRLVRRHRLSASEEQELHHLARGLPIKDSARALGISPETVRVRRKRVYRKMGLSGGHEALLARLCQEALLSPGEHDRAAQVNPA